LQKIWQSIEEHAGEVGVTELVHHDLPLVLRTLRDYVDDDIERVLVDSQKETERMRRFAHKYVPDVASRIECYNGEHPIFDLHSVEDEIQKSLQRNVQLKSGGYLMIDQTEAMTTIDVNTGGFIGHRNLEETIYKTNLEAAQAMARQLRLRNLGGIIIIDFIDMLEEEHKRQVMRALNKALDKDYARTHVSAVSELGLVEMTRKRTRESLEHVLCQTCPSCEGRGSVRTAESVCYEIFREIRRVSRLYTARELTILASQDVIDLLLDEQSSGLAELQSHTHATIRLHVESVYTREQYDVVIT
jgi:ribonuclease G